MLAVALVIVLPLSAAPEVLLATVPSSLALAAALIGLHNNRLNYATALTNRAIALENAALAPINAETARLNNDTARLNNATARLNHTREVMRAAESVKHRANDLDATA